MGQRGQFAFDFSAQAAPRFERGPIAYKDTSHQALRSFAPATGSLDEQIIGAIREAGDSGITCEAIEEKLQRSHQAVSGNLRHLCENKFDKTGSLIRAPLVRASGLHGLTRSNRKAMKWVLTHGTHQ